MAGIAPSAFISSNDFVLIARPEANYTSAARESARHAEIGVGKLADFMGALNGEKIWTYLNAEEKEALKKNKS